MLDADRVRQLALELPGAVEIDHHGRAAFRVGGKIFATIWTATELNVMAGDELILAAVASHPERCSLVYWGKRLAAVRIALDRADEELVRDLLQAAWSRRA